jgi:gas vesicle protein
LNQQAAGEFILCLQIKGEWMMQDRVVIKNNSLGYWAIGMIIGSLVGATVVLLMVPQPGAQTREQLARTGAQMRDRAKEVVEDARGRVTDAAGQVRSQVGQVISNVGGQSSGDQTTNEPGI